MKLKSFILKLDSFIPYRISVTSNRISRLIASIYSERFGLSIPEWRVIAILGDRNQETASELVERTAMDKVAVSRAVSSLVKKKLVRRNALQHDGRFTLLRLSLAGRRVYEEIGPLALDLEKDVLDNLSQEDIQTLHRILDQLGAKLDEMEIVHSRAGA